MKSIRYLLFLISILFLISCNKFPSNFNSFKKQKPAVNIEYEKIILPNGFSLIVHQDNSLPNVSLQVFVKAGTLTEENLLGTGVSHLVEHMLFESSDSKGRLDIAKEIKSGGGDINAYTSLDKTVYYIDIIGDNYEKGINVLYDALFKSEFTQKVFDKEKQVILKEIKHSLDSPDARIIRKLFNRVFDNNHPYAFPVIGYQSLFERLSIEDARYYYKRMYVPENMIMVISGDINIKEIKEKVKEKFGKEKRSIPYVYKSYNAPYKYSSYKEELIQKDTTVTHLFSGYKTKGAESDDDLVLDIISVMLGSGKDSILYRDLKYKNNIVYSVSASNYTLKSAGMFVFSSLFDYKNKEQVEETIFKHIKRLKNGNFSSKDLFNAKTKIKSDYIFSQESLSGRAGILAIYEFYFSCPEYYKDYLKRLDKINRKDIVNTARKYFYDKNLVTYIAKPHTIDKKTLSSSLEEKPILKEKKNPEIIYDKLDNGIKLIFYKRNSGPSTFSINFLLAGGVLFEGRKYNGVSNLLSELWLKGTKSMSASEISSFVENKGGSLSTFSGKNSLGISINMLSDHFEESINLLRQIVFESEFSLKEIEIEKKDIKAFLDEEKQDVFSVGINNLKKIYFKNHPYSLNSKGSEENIDNLTRKDINDFYEKILVPSNIIISVFGNIDKEKAKKIIKEKFGIYFKNKTYKKLGLPKISIKYDKDKKEIVETLPKKQSVIMFGFPGADAFNNDIYSLKVLNNMLSGLSGIIYEEVREKQGLAYSCGSTYFSGFHPGLFVLYVLTEKVHIENIKKTFYDIINKIKSGDFEETALENAKKSIWGRYCRNMELNSSFSFDVILDKLYNISYNNYIKFNKSKIMSITKKDIIKIVNKYFDETKMKISVIIGSVQ